MILNIGKNYPGGTLTDEEIKTAIKLFIPAIFRWVTINSFQTFNSDTEPTAVVKILEPFRVDAIYALAVALKQEAIAVLSEGKGYMIGPQAEKWGDFNPEFFIMPNGEPLAQPVKAAA